MFLISVILYKPFQIVVVGAGAKMSDVDKETVRHSLVTPLGSYSELGVAGFTLLGGTGLLSRSYGCAIDNALEFGKLMSIFELTLFNTHYLNMMKRNKTLQGGGINLALEATMAHSQWLDMT